MTMDFSCPDWEARLRDGRPPIPDLPLDEAAAARAVGIFDNLRLPDVAGHPRLAEAGGEWFRALVRAAFGSVDPETGERQVGEVFCLVPKKNSKTTNSAALGLTAMLMNARPNVEMLIVGPTQKVAETCFRQARGMIEADPPDPETGRRYLADRFHVIDQRKRITDRLNGSALEIKSFDMRVVTGSIPVLTILDELHVMGQSHHAASVLAQIRGGMVTTPDSLLWIITTQSDGIPAGVFKDELEYARRVRDGEVTGGNTLACLYEFPERVQLDESRPWLDPALWPQVLPNLGKSITLPRLQKLHAKAAEKGDREVTRWASQHLNIQVGMGTHDGRWEGADFWPKSGIPLGLEELMGRVEVACVGVDGGGLDDLHGLGVIGRETGTDRWLSWGRAWCQPEVMDKRKSIAPLLEQFARDGDLVICRGEPDRDIREIADICERLREAGLLPAEYGIGLDAANAADLQIALAARGITQPQVTSVGQGWKLQPAIKGAPRRLKNGTMRHAAQPLIAWCVSNTKVVQTDSAVRISKALAGAAKIDPVHAMLNAYMLMSRNPVAAGRGIADFLDNPVMVV